MAARNPSLILMYSGTGSGKESRKFLFHELKLVVDASQHSIRFISPRQILAGTWMEKTRLIIFGGGYDCGFESALGRKGAELIHQFVHNGGSYLGMCAGGYWACDYIEFDKAGPLEVTGERFLKFYPGLCIGPAFPGFEYNTKAGVSAAPIMYQGTTAFDAYYEGGGFFQPYREQIVSSVDKSAAEGLTTNLVEVCSEFTPHSTCPINNQDALISKSSIPVVDTIGTYTSLGKDAIVKCRVGNGVAILSGVHVEFSASLQDKDDVYLKKCLPELMRSENVRRLVFKNILSQLGVVCTSITSDEDHTVHPVSV